MRLGELLISKGLISEDQLAEALRASAESGDPLGSVLVDLRMITVEAMVGAIAAQRREAMNSGRLGDLLVERGLCTRVQIGRAVALQRTRAKPLGEILVEEAVITADELFDALEQQARRMGASQQPA